MGKERTKREQGGVNRLTRLFTQFDFYGEPVNFKIKGTDTFPSCLGTCISLLTMSLLIVYAAEKYLIMTSYGNTTYTSY